MARPRSARRNGESNGTSRKRLIEQYDHDGRSLYPHQVFFPTAGGDGG